MVTTETQSAKEPPKLPCVVATGYDEVEDILERIRNLTPEDAKRLVEVMRELM